MESFKHKNKAVEFSKVTGEVLSQNKYSETRVSSSGGGGYIGKQGGHVQAPKIQTTIIKKQEFWIKKADGTEESVKLTGYDIPLREGQFITLISATINDAKSTYYTALVNHSAKNHHVISNASDLNKYLKLDVISSTPTTILFVASVIFGAATNFFLGAIGVVATGIVSIFRFLFNKPRINKMIRSLDQHIEQLALKAQKEV